MLVRAPTALGQVGFDSHHQLLVVDSVCDVIGQTFVNFLARDRGMLAAFVILLKDIQDTCGNRSDCYASTDEQRAPHHLAFEGIFGIKHFADRVGGTFHPTTVLGVVVH